MRRALVLGASALMIVALAACGSQKVGNDSMFSSLHGTGTALGATTPTPAATAVATTTTTVAPTHAPVAAPPTAAPHVAPPTAPPTAAPAHFPISINSDSSGQPQFGPSASSVYAGTIVVWTNHDTVARSVVADAGAFNSGPIAPGASFSFTATAAGKFNYHDGTRPYAVASLQVVPR